MSEDLSKLNLVELFDRLIQPEEPAAISLWPQTAGWIYLAVVLVALGGVAIWRWLAWRRANAYRRAALDALQAAGDDAAGIAEVLRRCALAGFARHEVAGLHGAGWLAFLDRTADTAFSGSDAGQLLISAPYRTAPATKEPALRDMAALWIRTHRREGAA